MYPSVIESVVIYEAELWAINEGTVKSSAPWVTEETTENFS
jgi:hypothetical protein